MVSYPKTAWSGTPDHQSTTADAGSGRAGSAAARITVHEAIVDFLRAAEDGSTLDRYGRSFSRDALRELRWCLSGHVDDRLGTMRLGQVRRRDIEALIDQLAGAGLSRRRLRAVVKSVRALYDYASERGFADGNPAERVALPDEDDAEQPTRARPQQRHRSSVWHGADRGLISVDRALTLGLQAATIGFVLMALVYIAGSV